MRDVERQVMLRIIDQRWREHLEEMDYLQEGINLRAMGQKDPLVEWQREGFEMFGALMKGIAQDFVRYVMHVQVVRKEAAGAGRAERAADARPTTTRPTGFARGRAGGGGRRRARPRRPPPRRAGRRADQAAAGRQGRVVEDAAQRAVPVRVGQEVQDVPRRHGLNAPRARCVTSPTT